jgi:hypothetical protein
MVDKLLFHVKELNLKKNIFNLKSLIIFSIKFYKF